MSASNDDIYVLNSMNAKAAKVQLGQLISDAESIVAAEIALANGSILVGNGSGIAAAVTMSGDVSISNLGVAAIGSGVIVNADVNASAAIDGSKIAPTFTSATTLGDTSATVTHQANGRFRIEGTDTATSASFSGVGTGLNLVLRNVNGGANTFTGLMVQDPGSTTYRAGIIGEYMAAGGNTVDIVFANSGGGLTESGRIAADNTWSLGAVGNTTTTVIRAAGINMTESTGTGNFSVRKSTDTGSASFSGGSGSGSGANIFLYGGTHSTDANDILLRSGGTNRLAWDDSAVLWTATGALTVNGKLIGQGTATNDSAATGYIGEHLTQTRLRSSSTALTTATEANITATALTLTAGDWEVEGMVGFAPAATTSIARLFACISTTSATAPNNDTWAVQDSAGQISWINTFNAEVPGLDIVSAKLKSRVSISSTTTYYLVAYANFTVSTMTAYGSIRARRVR